MEEGEVHSGSKVEILSRDPNQVTVGDISLLYFSKVPDPELLLRAISVSALRTLPRYVRARLQREAPRGTRMDC